MQKRALLVTTVSGFVPQFESDNVQILKDMGFEVHYATNLNNPSYGDDNRRLDEMDIICHQIDFARSPFSFKNIRAYRQLRRLLKEEHFELIHCHTPMGGVLARLAAHATHTSPVIYTAHGFHFYKGAKFINWLLYYPAEKFLSRYTDEQICINREDYSRAKRKFHAKNVDYIPGAGFDLSTVVNMTAEQRAAKRKELGIPADAMVLLSSGEFIKRKNHETAIRALAEYQKNYAEEQTPDIYLVLCGHGELEKDLKALARSYKIEDRIKFPGYRDDMMEIYPIADIFLFPSYQEGLPMALLEAMGSGLPVIASDIRGTRDLLGRVMNESKDLKLCRGGIMVKKADDAGSYATALHDLLSIPEEDRKKMGMANARRSRMFSRKKVHDKMTEIYGRLSATDEETGNE